MSGEISAPKDGNWGRWGDEDERGAANFADKGVVKRSASLVEQGRVFNLSIEISNHGMPTYEGRGGPLHAMTIDGGDFAAGLRLPDDFGMADDWIGLGCHSATHVDALAHVWHDAALYNGHDPARVRSNGAAICGIEKLRALVTRGILLDLPALHGVEHLEGGYAVTAKDVDDALAGLQLTVSPGDCVLVRTGWWRVFREDRDVYYASAPGLSDESARRLAALQISAVGLDTMAAEVMPARNTFEGGARMPVAHRALIRDYGIYVLELLDLEELSEAGAREFMFVLAPLLIRGGTASPVSPLAIT